MTKWSYKVIHVDYVPDRRKAELIEESLTKAVEEIKGEIVETQFINPSELRYGLFIVTIKEKGGKSEWWKPN